MRVLHCSPAHRSELVRIRRIGLLTHLAVLIAASLSCVLSPATASAETRSSSAGTAALGYSLTPSSTEPYAACPRPTSDRAQCLVIIDPSSSISAPIARAA